VRAGGLVAHQDADVVELLPAAVQGEERADFEEAGGDVERAGDFRPVLEIAKSFPAFVAVIDGEQFTAFR
jgi:hypothetical protein